jgi:acetyl esterase/lipase
MLPLMTVWGTAVLTMAVFGGTLKAQEAKPIASAKQLWAGAAPMAEGNTPADTPTLATYLPTSNPTRTGVVIAPGGGYGFLSIDKEGVDIAHWLNKRGVAAFVLQYRLGPKYHYPVQLDDAQRAIRTVRSQASSLAIDPARIGMWGFSAGGHLTAMTGTLFDLGDASATDPIDRASSRPDFLVLAYPVITMDATFTHMGSRQNLLGANPDAALVEKLSTEKQVSAKTPPTFLFATSDDNVVPVANSVAFYSALVRAKVPAEMHLFQHGPHGTGLAQGYPKLKIWPDLLAAWMQANGWMTSQK